VVDEGDGGHAVSTIITLPEEVLSAFTRRKVSARTTLVYDPALLPQ